MTLINRNYTRMWIGYAVSALGDQIFDTTVLLWLATVLLKGDRYAPVAVGGVVITVAVATIAVSPVAGVLADRWDKRRTMLVTDAIRAALAGVLAAAAFLPAGAIGTVPMLVLVYATIALSTAATRFFTPAWFTLTGDVVPDETGRAKASGYNQATTATMAIIGPPLAAPLLFTIGFQWALVANAVSFAISFLAVRGVRPPASIEPAPAASTRTGIWREYAVGLRFLRTHRVVRTIYLSAAIVTVGSGALNTLGVFFISENLHASPSLYGLIGTAEGVGLVIGALLVGAIVGRIGPVRLFAPALIAVGVVAIAYAWQRSLVGGAITIAVAGALMGLITSCVGPIVLANVPRELLGRVVSVLSPVQQLAGLASALASGWLAATVLAGLNLRVGPMTFGRIDTIYTVAGLAYVLGGVYAAVMLRERPGSAAAVPAQAASADSDPVTEAR